MKKLFLVLLSLIFLKSDSQTTQQIQLYDIQEVEIIACKPKIYHGIDISYYQHNIDWKNFDTTISFVICKATEGVSRVDSKLKSNWDNINVTKGCYHFFRPQHSGIKQAKFYLSNAKLGVGNIKPIIDVEHTPMWKYKKNRKKYVQNLVQMVEYIEKETGQIPIIYTSASFWNDYIDPYYTDKDHILWVADYRGKDDPKTPKGLPDWTIWQYSSKGKIKGIRPYVDKNICKDISVLVWK